MLRGRFCGVQPIGQSLFRGTNGTLLQTIPSATKFSLEHLVTDSKLTWFNLIHYGVTEGYIL